MPSPLESGYSPLPADCSTTGASTRSVSTVWWRKPTSRAQPSTGTSPLIGTTTTRPGFRGDWFINAAAEYPDPDHPVRLAIREHREWFQTTMTKLAERIGHPDPALAGQILVLLHDGALTAAPLDDAVAVRDAVTKAALATLYAHGA